MSKLSLVISNIPCKFATYYQNTHQEQVKMKKIKPLSGRGETIQYRYLSFNEVFDVKWGKAEFSFNMTTVNKILNNFFKNEKEWYPLGASMDPIMKGGMGEFILNLNAGLLPRHASAIASILVEEGILVAKGKRPISLRKIKAAP